MLGKRPDPVVAHMLGRTKFAVQLKRHALGIPQSWERGKPWTAKDESLLGTERDQIVAKKLNRSVLSVRTQRLMKTKVKLIRTTRRWTKQELEGYWQIFRRRGGQTRMTNDADCQK